MIVTCPKCSILYNTDKFDSCPKCQEQYDFEEMDNELENLINKLLKRDVLVTISELRDEYESEEE